MAEEGNTIGNAYVQIMPSMEGATDGIYKAIGAEDLGAKAGKSIGDGMFKGISKKLGGIAAAVGGAIAGKAVISGLQDIGAQFDEMTDNIIVGTGASGSALEALKDSAKGIATAVGGSFADAGDVVQDLNTRLGLTGGNLDAVGQRVVAAGKLIGSAINTEQLSGAFTAFDVGADQMADKMDYLFSVSQNTGIGFDTLTGIIEKNAVPLREMGMSFEESANMAGLLDKAGLNASSVMAKMSKALVSLAKPGESAADAFRRTVGEIGDYIDAGNQAAAIELASKVFGTKGAAEFVGAIQSGALALDSLTDSAVGAGAGIMGTFEATADWPEKLDILKNKFTEILEPLGSAVFSSFGDSLDLVGEALDEMDPSAMQALSKSVAGFVSSGVQKVIDFGSWVLDHFEDISGYVGLAADSFTALTAPIGSVAFTALADTLQMIGDAVQTIDPECVRSFADAVGAVVGAGIDAIADFGQWVIDNFQTVATLVGVGTAAFVAYQAALAISGVINAFRTAMEAATTATSGMSAAQGILNAVMAANPIGLVVTAIAALVAGVVLAYQNCEQFRNIVNAAFNAILGVARPVISFIAETAPKAFEALGNLAGNAIRDLQNTVKTVFNGLKAIMTDPIGAAKDAIKKIIGDIVGFFTGAKFTWPKIPMPHFIVKPSGWQIGDLLKGSIPSLDLQFYARGGLVDSPVNAIIGEAGPEAIVPLSRPAITPWAEEVAAVVGTDQTVSEKIEALHRDLYQIIRDAVPKDFSMNGRTWMEAREEAMAYR